MTKKRLSMLAKLVGADQIKKEALSSGEIAAEVDQVDPATADKLAQKIYEQVFDEELKKLLGSS